MSIKNGHIAIDFIDPLFATVISLSFSHIMMQPWFSASYLFGYFQSPWLLFSGLSTRAKLQLGGVLLAYLTVVTSWVGYHVSIKRSPIDVETRAGFFRFVLDIVLLALYWLLLVNFQSLTFQLYLLVLIFFTFIPWDQLKAREYKSQDNVDSQRRRGVTTFWLLVFLLIYILYFSGVSFPATVVRLSVGWRDAIFLAAAAVSLILYRFHKNKLVGGRLLDLLSFHKPGFYVHAMRIYIAGPYTAEDPSQIEMNVDKAIDAGVEVYRRGHFPFIPHLTHFVEIRTKHTGKVMRWEDYISWDRSWLDKTDALLYLGKSRGADIELEYARSKGKKIFTSLEDIPKAGRSEGS